MAASRKLYVAVAAAMKKKKKQLEQADLFGPKAAEWGEFKLEFFKRFDSQGNAI